MPGFRIGTALYRKSYALTEFLDHTAERVLQLPNPGLRRRQEQLVRRISDLRMRDRGRPLLDDQHVQQVEEVLLPGDIILTRQEWYLSNLAMPGFWKHSLIYVGTPEERRSFFSTPEVSAWAGEQGHPEACFDGLLQHRHTAAHARSRLDQVGGGRATLSSAADGVRFEAIRDVAAVDSLAVLRPRMSRLALAQALDTAFGFEGAPYDYLFDFDCDETFICSEVIYKAYRAQAGREGLALRTRYIAGRAAMPTNDLAQMYAERLDTEEQDLDLVLFLDGDERSGRVEQGSEADFASSWNRSHWDHALSYARGRLV